MADAITFSEEASVPDDLGTFRSLLQVLVLFKHLTASDQDKHDVFEGRRWTKVDKDAIRFIIDADE